MDHHDQFAGGKEIFEKALDIEGAADRERYLKNACGQDARLLERVQQLLRAHDAKDFLRDEPAGGGAGAETPKSTILLTMPDEKPGTIIGRYKLLEKIGEGGFGIVYVAEQREPVKRRVALKIIKLGMDTKEVVARFEAERQALALMDHPNIAKVLDAGSTESGRPYFVMELVRGIKLTAYCDQNNLPTIERLKLFIQICHAIQHAHQKGIIHRDIKPSNILVTLHDGVPVPKVIDFGIAKATQFELTEKTVYTQLQQFIGTPAYMSPEQAEMSGLDIDTRSDIYSLGVLLYELLTGHPPFDPRELAQAGLDEIRRIIREEEPPKPSTRLSTMQAAAQTTVARHRQTEPPKLIKLVRGDLDWIVMKCLEKDRTRRYETANTLAMDIRRHLDREPVIARPPSALYRLQKWARRHQANTRLIAAVILFLIGLGIIGGVSRFGETQGLRPMQPTPPAPILVPERVAALPAGEILKLVFTGTPPLPTALAANPQLQVDIWAARRGQTNFTPVKDGDSLASREDKFLLRIRPGSPGYLYLLQIDSSGKCQWLFPSNGFFEFSSGQNPVGAGHIFQVPAMEANQVFLLDETVGIEHVYAVFSATRWRELEEALGRPAASHATSQVALRSPVVEQPNGLRSRGIAGTTVHPGPITLAEAPKYETTNTFLVIERWFRHVSSR